jgi:hypothetical protein
MTRKKHERAHRRLALVRDAQRQQPCLGHAVPLWGGIGDIEKEGGSSFDLPVSSASGHHGRTGVRKTRYVLLLY